MASLWKHEAGSTPNSTADKTPDSNANTRGVHEAGEAHQQAVVRQVGCDSCRLFSRGRAVAQLNSVFNLGCGWPCETVLVPAFSRCSTVWEAKLLKSNLKSMMVSRHTMNHHDTGKHMC